MTIPDPPDDLDELEKRFDARIKARPRMTEAEIEEARRRMDELDAIFGEDFEITTEDRDFAEKLRQKRQEENN